MMLYSVYLQGSDYQRVAAALRRMGRQNPEWGVPPLPPRRPSPTFSVTIADLGSFDAETYPRQLDLWCKAALEGWR